MRLSSLATLLAFATVFDLSFAQTAPPTAAEAKAPTYNKHHDTRFGHDHFYPDRGTIIKTVPKAAAVVNYAGLAFRFHDGVWYEPRGAGFMVVAPPIGLVVSALPTFATLLARGGQTLVYCNDVYYRPRPDVDGYEVVNDPTEATFQVGREPASSGAQMGDNESSATGATGVVGAVGAMGAGAGSTAATPPQALSTTTPIAQSAAPEVVTSPLPAAVNAAMPANAGTSSTQVAPTTSSLPSSGLAATSTAAQSKGIKVSLMPKNGQDAEQQARDRYECYRFAAAQSGFDPMHSSVPNAEYDKAQTACLQGRGYALQ